MSCATVFARYSGVDDRLVVIMNRRSTDIVRLIDFPLHGEAGNGLVVLEAATGMPFPIARVFVVTAGVASSRGRHAHKRCSQVLVCLHGVCEVKCSDGDLEATYRLEDASHGLVIPPSIWAEQTYLAPETTLMVLCDHPYEAEDYIRDFDEFRRYRKATEQSETP